MYQYTLVQWLFFFYFYCFFGWCFESTVVSVDQKKLVNRGFMRGPFLPIYGSGAIMMLLVSRPFQDSLILTYVAGCVGATVLEYVTGVTMEALFKVRYWDYSDKKFNFQGHICLSSTLAWGFLTILMTEVVHKEVEKLVFLIPGNVLDIATYVLSLLIFADFALSFKAALDLRDVLMQMERAKAELMRVQKRLDVVIAVTSEDLSNRKEELQSRKEEFAEGLQSRKEELAEEWQSRREEFAESMEELAGSIEEKLIRLRDVVLERPSEYTDKQKEELRELFARYHRNLEERRRLSSIKDFFQKDLIRSNPGMRSVRFDESLEELKKMAERKGKGQDKAQEKDEEGKNAE